jgi:hypothetical protein
MMQIDLEWTGEATMAMLWDTKPGVLIMGGHVAAEL